MPGDSRLSARFGADSTDFKNGIRDINRELKVIDSGFKATAATMEDWSNNSQGLEARMGALTKEIQLQGEKCAALKYQQEQMAKAHGENSVEAQNAQIEFNKEAEKLNKLQTELGQTTRSLETMKTSTGGIKGAFKDLGTQLDKLGNEVPMLGTALRLMTNPVALAGAGLAALGKYAQESTEKASELNETVSKTGVVFDSEAQKVIEFGKNADESLGMSENAALSAAATYGNLFRSMGMASDKSAEMSINLVQLAGDLASFNNLDPTEVMDKLRAGLTGEAEPLKSLGININEAILKQKALDMGLWKGKGTLDASSKAQAAYALMLEQTSLAQGDFARTSDQAANQQRILRAQVDNLEASLGKKLLPTTIKVTAAINDFLQANLDDADAQEKVTQLRDAGLISGLEYYNMMTAIARGIQSNSEVLSEYQDKLKQLALIEEIEAAAKEKYSGIIDGYRNDVVPATVAVQEATTAVIDFRNVHGSNYQQALQRARDRVRDAKNAVKDYEQAQKDAVQAMQTINDYVNGQLGPNQEKFNETQADLTAQMEDMNGQIDEAIDKYGENSDKVAELKGKYEDLKGQYEENAKAHEDETKRIILGILEQQMALAGLTDPVAFATIAKNWGLIDQATVDATINTAKAVNWLKDHPGDYQGFLDMLNGVYEDVTNVGDAADTTAGKIDEMTGTHDVVINIKVTGDKLPDITQVGSRGGKVVPQQEGGVHYVTRPTYFLAGEGGEGETVIVIPDSMRRAVSSIQRGMGQSASQLNSLGSIPGGGAAPAVRGGGGGVQPIQIILQGAPPEDEMKMRRMARYVATEIQKRSS